MASFPLYWMIARLVPGAAGWKNWIDTWLSPVLTLSHPGSLNARRSVPGYTPLSLGVQIIPEILTVWIINLFTGYESWPRKADFRIWKQIMEEAVRKVRTLAHSGSPLFCMLLAQSRAPMVGYQTCLRRL